MPVIGPGQMQGVLNYVCEWSKKNDINLNQPKTIFIEITFSLSGEAHPLVIQSEIIESLIL